MDITQPPQSSPCLGETEQTIVPDTNEPNRPAHRGQTPQAEEPGCLVSPGKTEVMGRPWGWSGEPLPQEASERPIRTEGRHESPGAFKLDLVSHAHHEVMFLISPVTAF